MKPIQDVFLETQWGDEETARQARDDRAAQLQAQGLVCNCENLYTVDGYRVFLVEATESELDDIPTSKRDRYSTLPKRADRPMPRSSSRVSGEGDSGSVGVEHPPNLYRKRKRAQG
jgi:hypothetical protein